MSYKVNWHYPTKSSEVFEIIKDLKKIINSSFYLMKIGLYSNGSIKIIVFTYLDDIMYVFSDYIKYINHLQM